MKILITGSCGFIGRNLVEALRNRGYDQLFLYDIDTSEKELDSYTMECDFVFHLAGVNRPAHESDFMSGNCGFTSALLEKLKRHKNKASVLMTSSIQAEINNPYGESKKVGEGLLFNYEKQEKAKVFVYRLPNVFGKWCRPNYNSVVATFCNNIASGQPIQIDDPSTQLRLVYVDDVVDSFIAKLQQPIRSNRPNQCGFEVINPVYTVSLGMITDLLFEFRENRKNLMISNMGDEFTKKLYSTYLSYLPDTEFSYPLKVNTDDRGSFTEFLKSPDRGQVSVNISKPHITKGNHWHNTKNEKFLVVGGIGVIRFRKIGTDKIIEYFVSGERLEVIDIPVGYTHNIENLGDVDMITIMWCNELFDKERSDTFFLPV